MNLNVEKAVILSAGKGTRVYPLSKSIPKTMLPLGGKPAMQFLVEELADAGIKEILIIVGHNYKVIKQYFTNIKCDNFFYKLKNVKIFFKKQSILNGTGGAVKLAKNFVGNNNFFVAFADDITNPQAKVCSQLINAFLITKKSIMAVRNVEFEEAHKYGIILTKSRYLDLNLNSVNKNINYENFENKNNILLKNKILYKFNKNKLIISKNHIKLKALTIKSLTKKNIYSKFANLFLVEKILEKPKNPPSTLTNFGRYVFSPEIFYSLKHVKKQFNKEIYLTDALQNLSAKNQLIAVEFNGQSFDIGSIESYIKTFLKFCANDKFE